jgi:hypothetical protein
MLKLKRRHLPTCKATKPNAKCMCPIHVDGMHDGKRLRYSLDTFNWEDASRKLLEITIGGAQKNSSVVDAVTDFIKDCDRRELKASGVKKYKELLEQLKNHCAGRAITTVRLLTMQRPKHLWKGFKTAP